MFFLRSLILLLLQGQTTPAHDVILVESHPLLRNYRHPKRFQIHEGVYKLFEHPQRGMDTFLLLLEHERWQFGSWQSCMKERISLI